MHIANVKLKDFKRFHDLSIEDLPREARLVILAGPNGCGKSFLFDAFSWSHFSSSGRGSWDGIWDYYIRPGSQADNINNRIDIQFHDAVDRSKKGNFYFRSAYRQEADFTLKNLTQIGDPTEEEKQIRKMMASDVSVSKNYQRLASQALLDAFAVADAKMTLAEFRENVIGELRRTILDLFPNLDLNTLGNPLEEGTFRFNKGQISGFKYKNLSGGEKAAFDLILDIVVKKKAYANSVYCIDEPELHMNTRLQGGLLDAILKVLPQESQLWISTHSIGMMRKAQELWKKNPLEVVFLDFGSIDPDTTSVLRPSRPTKSFWQNILSIALDDLAELVAPQTVIICEGNPISNILGKNVEFDAICYNEIFSDEMPEVKFISGGSSSSVLSDKIGLAKAIPMLTRGVVIKRLIDRDDHAPQDVIQFLKENVIVLERRTIESYLYDDEILILFCKSLNKEDRIGDVLSLKKSALEESVLRGNPADDFKSAAGMFYGNLRKSLQLTEAGNDRLSFARNRLAPLIDKNTRVYKELRDVIFGS